MINRQKSTHIRQTSATISVYTSSLNFHLNGCIVVNKLSITQ